MQHSENATLPPQRLDTARERIRIACAEYNYFNPNFSLKVQHSSPFPSNGEVGNEHGLCPPDPGQLITDLQKLFERIVMLESVAADQVYEDISAKIWLMATDEYGEFDWEKFKDIIGYGLNELNQQGLFIELSDLAMLRSTAALL